MNFEPEKILKKISNINTDKTKKSSKIILVSSQIILSLLILLLIILVYFSLSVYHAILVSSPVIELKSQLPKEYSTTIYDYKNKAIESIQIKDSERKYVKLNEIPNNVQNAFLSIISPNYWNENENSELTKLLLKEYFSDDAPTQKVYENWKRIIGNVIKLGRNIQISWK